MHQIPAYNHNQKNKFQFQTPLEYVKHKAKVAVADKVEKVVLIEENDQAAQIQQIKEMGDFG